MSCVVQFWKQCVSSSLFCPNPFIVRAPKSLFSSLQLERCWLKNYPKQFLEPMSPGAPRTHLTAGAGSRFCTVDLAVTRNRREDRKVNLQVKPQTTARRARRATHFGSLSSVFLNCPARSEQARSLTVTSVHSKVHLLFFIRDAAQWRLVYFYIVSFFSQK